MVEFFCENKECLSSVKTNFAKKNIIDRRLGFKYTSGNILCEAIKSETKYIYIYIYIYPPSPTKVLFFLLHHICQNQEISIPNKLSSNNNK